MGSELEVTNSRAYAELLNRSEQLDALALLDLVVRESFAGRIVSVASFGAESAVLLAMLAEVSPATPVIFLDTGKHFQETLIYRDALAARIGLTDLRVIHPDPAQIARHDASNQLWREDPDLCCQLRKVVPLAAALDGFDAWISGRKRFQGWTRAGISKVEWAEGRVKINPLADWSAERISSEFVHRDLPRHPLAEYGYLSIGCAPCTTSVSGDPAVARAGRWVGHGKTECGIHSPGLVQAIRHS